MAQAARRRTRPDLDEGQDFPSAARPAEALETSGGPPATAALEKRILEVRRSYRRVHDTLGCCAFYSLKSVHQDQWAHWQKNLRLLGQEIELAVNEIEKLAGAGRADPPAPVEPGW